jgi:hypothetical protein
MKQAAQQRYVLHLLNATPVLRGSSSGENAVAVEVIEDLTPLENVACNLALAEPVSAVRLAPEGTALPYTQNEGRLEFIVPRLVGSQMVELAY